MQSKDIFWVGLESDEVQVSAAAEETTTAQPAAAESTTTTQAPVEVKPSEEPVVEEVVVEEEGGANNSTQEEEGDILDTPTESNNTSIDDHDHHDGRVHLGPRGSMGNGESKSFIESGGWSNL